MNDSKEKRAVGHLWADQSDGQCLFVMPKGKDWAAIEAVLAGGAWRARLVRDWHEPGA